MTDLNKDGIDDSLQAVDVALQAAQQTLPTILGTLGIFIPQLAVLSRFLPLLGVAIQGVRVISEATGKPPSLAMASVQSHLLPGKPNAQELKG